MDGAIASEYVSIGSPDPIRNNILLYYNHFYVSQKKHTHTHIHTHTYTYINTHTYTLTHACIHTHAHAHTHTHARTHTCMHIKRLHEAKHT